MTSPEIPARAPTRYGQASPPWACLFLVALAALPATDLQAQEWRFDIIDRRFVDQQRAIDWRFNNLGQRLQRLDKELWNHRLSHQDIQRIQGLVSVLRDVVRGLQREMASLRQLIEPPQPSNPLPADIRRLPL